MVDPATPLEHLVIQNVAFDPETVTITYTVQSEVRITGRQTVMVESHQLTISRTEDFVEPTESLEDEVKELLLDVARIFVNSPAATDAEKASAAAEEDDDEFRGMGE